jgi:hypothetical protein
LRMTEAVVEVGRSRAAAASGNLEAAAAHAARTREMVARARAAGAFGVPCEVGSSDARIAARLVKLALAALEAAMCDAAGASVGIDVAEGGRWLKTPSGARVSLARHRAIRLMLDGLADRRLRAPGQALSIEALFEVGWPGERASPEAARGRVYTGIRSLRRLGLERELLRRDDGYLLDPSVPIRRTR